MKKVLSIASSSSSVVYGNISCAVRDHIISKFPYEFFTYVHLSSEIAYRNIYRQFGMNNSMKEINKRQKPYIVIRPIYQATNMDSFLNDIPLTKNFDNAEYGFDKRHLFNVIQDPNNGYNLKYKMNRDRIEFDVTVTLSTLTQQLDIYKYMLNQMVWERPYIHKTSLETMLPRSIIAYIGKITEYDILDEKKNMLPVLIRYMNEVSTYPITYKIRNASARDEFFMYYNHNVMITLSDLNIEDGNKKNMSDDSYNITFRISAEFSLPGVFMLEGTSDLKYDLEFDLVSKTVYSNTSEFIPIFTIENIYNRYPPYHNGLRLYTSSMFNIDGTKTKHDDLDISPIFDNEVRHVLNEYLRFNTPISTFVKLIILKDREELVEDTDYSVDWNKMSIRITNLDKTSTYRLIVYMNMNKLNTSMIDMNDKHDSDKSKI